MVSNSLNILNLVGYIINVLAVGFGPAYLGLPNNAELSRKYQTIVTPADWAFAIWGVIFLCQGIFVIAQLFRGYRGSPLVQEGIRCYYVATCFFQVIWTFLFAMEYLLLSFGAMVGILVSLILLVRSQYKPEVNSTTTVTDYFFLRFPFEIHLGWIIAATAVSLNLILIAPLNASATIQLVAAVGSLVVFLIVSIGVLFRPSPPIYVIAAVLAWATVAIWAELFVPDQTIQNQFDDDVIGFVRTSAFIVSAVMIILAVVRMITACSTYRHYPDDEKSTYWNADVNGTGLRRF